MNEAVSDVESVLKAAGIEVIVNRINVTTKELAVLHRFESSPTVRVNGRDINVDIKESLCESCGELCGENVDCRIWTYQGQEYTVPPKALIVNAILSEVYGNNPPPEPKEFSLPKNLEAYFTAMENKNMQRDQT